MRGSKWIRPKRRLAIYLRDGFACGYCGIDLHGAKENELSLDHLKPLSKGGTHTSNNLITCCAYCNSSRKDRPLKPFAGRNYNKIQALRKRDMARYLAQATRLLRSW